MHNVLWNRTRVASALALMCLTGLGVSASTGSPETAAPFESVKEGAPVRSGGVSRGVAWGDYDGDGLVDLYVANTSDQPGFLFRNAGGGRLVRMTSWAGADLPASSEGASWADYDNDGDLDLFVTNRGDGVNFLYRNDRGVLVRVTDSALVADRGESTSHGWADVDRDGDLDLFVARRNKQNDLLFSNNGNGTFKKITEGPVVNSGGDSRACGWADADLDGDLDLFVGNAHEPSFFFRNDGDWKFTRLTEGPFVTTTSYTYGVSWADYDNDGDFDLFVANVLQPNLLYTNDGSGTFARVEGRAISDAVGPSKGNAWGDYDNDGDLDLFVANGTPDRDSRDFLFRNDGRRGFTRVTAGSMVTDEGVSAGAAWADCDNDGDLDMFVANWGGEGENDAFYLNKGGGGRWLAIRTVGTRSNRSGIGARIRVTATIGGRRVVRTRLVSGQTGYGSQSDARAHFGLGDARRVETVEIFWPSGRVERVAKVPMDRMLVATEGRGIR